ncbi:hypothetical protein LSCM4_05814 [Leishmania orientalis]|uniref:Uncharacterized protein n=1 Tax=Leishmania orientalis TaxID=2249476 RepID=A0A836GR62_9TRYP|nr:hypothetical protein LSCM4_05814 [Leishmania orientalis]
MHSAAGMSGANCSEAQSPATLSADVASAAAIAEAVDAGHHGVSRSPSESTSASTPAFSSSMQQPILPPAPPERVFPWRCSPSGSPPIAGTRPSRWPSTSPRRACGRLCVTFAPSTRFDQCRQRANVAVRRPGGELHFPPPCFLLEPPLSSMCSSEGRLTVSALRAAALLQPNFLASSRPTPSPQRPPASAESQGVGDVVIDDFSDTSSSADSACSTNSSSLTLLDTYAPAVQLRPPPSLALDLPLPSVTLRAPSEHPHPSAFSLADGIGISAVAAVGAATGTTPPSLTHSRSVRFASFESELTRTTATTHGFAATTDVLSERRHVDGAATERASTAPVGCRDGILSTHPKDETCMTPGMLPPPLLLESHSLSSTPEATPSTGPVELPLSPPASSLQRMNPRMMLLAPDTPDKQLHEAPLHDALLSDNATLVVNAAVDGAAPQHLKSSSAAIPAHPRWGGEASHDAPQTTGGPACRAEAVISTVGIGSAPSLDIHDGAAIDAHPTTTTAPLHASFLTAATGSSGGVGDGCEGALGSSCISASLEKVGKDSMVVGAPSPPCSRHHSAEPCSPRDQECRVITSAAAADALWLLSPSPAPALPRPRLFQHSPERSTGWTKCRRACEAERFPSSSDELHRERGRETSEGSSQQPLLSDAARRASLQISWEKCVATSVALASRMNCVTANAGICAVVGDSIANPPPPAKELIHSGSSDIGAGAPFVAKPRMGAATAVSPLPLKSPAPPRSLLAAPYWSSFHLSDDQDSGRLSRCPQRQPPRQPRSPFDAITTAATSKPCLSSSPPVPQQLRSFDAPTPLTLQSRAASVLSPNLSFPSIPLLHALPMFRKCSHTLTTTISTKATARQYFSGSEAPSSSTPTPRSGIKFLSPLPPLTTSALYGASTLTPPEVAHKTAEQRQRAEFYNLRGCKSLPAPLHQDTLVICAPLQPRAPLLRGTTGSRTPGCTCLCSRSSSPVQPPPLARLSPSKS